MEKDKDKGKKINNLPFTKKMSDMPKMKKMPNMPNVPNMPNMPNMPKMKKMPNMPKKEKFQLCAFPSNIHCSDHYPLMVTFPNSANINNPNKGTSIKHCLTHMSQARVPSASWCLVVMITATVKGAPYPLCPPKLVQVIGHDECGVLLNRPCYALGQLSTHISFTKTPTTMTSKHSSQLFLQVSIFKDAEDIFTTTPIPLYFQRSRHHKVWKVEVELFSVNKKGWVYISFFNLSPTLAIPFVTVDPYLLTTWVKDPIQELVPRRHVAFHYDPVTGEVVGPLEVLCKH
jgi:hypothetical protein